MDDLIKELKVFLINTLSLEDIEPSDIEADAPLFNEGLGLDSIDALEIGVGLQKEYDIKIDAKSEETYQAFSSLNNLAAFIRKHRGEDLTTEGNPS